MTYEEQFSVIEERAKRIGESILLPGCTIHCKKSGSHFLFRLDKPDGKVYGVSKEFLVLDAMGWSDTTFANVIGQLAGLAA